MVATLKSSLQLLTHPVLPLKKYHLKQWRILIKLRNSVQSTANMATSEGIYHFHSVRKHYEQYHNLVSKGRLDEDLLFSDSLLRLWRTGADEYLYSSSEDGDCDVSYY